MYWIPRHVHLCVTHDGVVFLDVRKDKYLGISGRQARSLEALVSGWPAAPTEENGARPRKSSDASALAEALVAKGLLTRDCRDGKSATPVAVDPIDMSLEKPAANVTLLKALTHAASFFFAVGTAALTLKFRGLETTLKRVEARKARAPDPARAVDLRRADELTAIFRRLQLFTYTKKDKCLFDALALINFLAWHGQFPLFVIGVKTHAFAAHSWVQHGHHVLDSSPEMITEFTAIFAV